MQGFAIEGPTAVLGQGLSMIEVYWAKLMRNVRQESS